MHIWEIKNSLCRLGKGGDNRNKEKEEREREGENRSIYTRQ